MNNLFKILGTLLLLFGVWVASTIFFNDGLDLDQTFIRGSLGILSCVLGGLLSLEGLKSKASRN